MARYSSDSESDSDRRRSSKKSKKKSKSRRRSRSSSYENKRSRDSRRRSRSGSRGRSRSSERSRSYDDRKRRHRSRSADSHRSRRSHKRSRSRSPRRRARSRSSSRDNRSSRRHRSRSSSRERSSGKRSKRSKKRSRSRERTSSKKELPKPRPRDPCEDIPGFSEMTPAQQSRLRVQAAFKAVESNAPTQEKSSPVANPETALDQMERAQVIADIEDEGFLPTHFSSSRSNKPKEAQKVPSWPTNLAEQEDYHEMAIFGNSNALGLDEKSRKQISDATEAAEPTKIRWKDRDPKTLAHPSLRISKEEADRRWIEKLTEMRTEALKSLV